MWKYYGVGRPGRCWWSGGEGEQPGALVIKVAANKVKFLQSPSKLDVMQLAFDFKCSINTHRLKLCFHRFNIDFGGHTQT